MKCLLDELHVRLYNDRNNLNDLKDFCADNVSKYQLQAVFFSCDLDFLSQLKIILIWLKDSPPEFCREINEWFVTMFRLHWAKLIPQKTDIMKWKRFCYDKESGGYETGLDKFFSSTEIMDIEYVLFYNFNSSGRNLGLHRLPAMN